MYILWFLDFVKVEGVETSEVDYLVDIKLDDVGWDLFFAGNLSTAVRQELF